MMCISMSKSKVFFLSAAVEQKTKDERQIADKRCVVAAVEI